MVTEQETLIYIEDQDKHDASVAANAFAHKDTKNRAYINTLGAELAIKYLASENIDVSNIHNIHSIKKILEEMDISDIMLPNIHIDVRVVFDENIIFIPKSHFEYNLVPDIYLVLYLAKDFSHVKFLGFFEPKLINKNNANDKYYFIEKEKLSSVKDLKHYIESHKGNTVENLSEEELTNSERIIISMADNEISDNDKKYLIKQLTKSAELRDKFLEYENFETLSYKAMTDPHVDRENIEDKLTLLEVNNLTDTNTEEAIANLTDIETPAADETEPVAENKEDNLLSDIAETTVEGAAAIAGAVAADSIINNIEETLPPVEPTLDFTEIGIDTTNKLSDDNTSLENEPLSFDNIDTSTLDDIPTTENEQIEEQAISLNDIEAPENNVQTDFIDTIDNKISFEDLPETPETLNEPAPLNIDEDKISLDDVDILGMSSEDTDADTYKEETISFDNIDTSGISPDIDFDENALDNKISFDNINTENEQNDSQNQNYEEETVSFESFDNENTVTPAITDETEISDFMDDTVTLDDMPQQPVEEQDETVASPENKTENINPSEAGNDIEPVVNIDDLPEIDNIENNFDNTEITASDIAGEPDIVENVSENTSESQGFGKNLIENLSAENLDDISIEDLGLDDVDIPDSNPEDISSNDLLSQVDDILTSTSDVNSTAPEETKVENTDFDDIPDISELTNEPSSESLNQPSEASLTNTENMEAAEDISIDDLLNGDSFEPHDDNPNEEDNIDVLFNDTDPVTDAELDNMEDFNQTPVTNEEEMTQAIPGAALYNKKQKNNKSVLLVAAALVAVIAAASAVMVLKPKNDSANNIEPITPANTETAVTDNPLTASENSSSTNNILATNAPDIKKTDNNKNVKTPQQTKELKNTALKPKQNSSQAYLDVSKLVWDVPDTLSYSPKMQSYLRTAGKSIKLSLSADLLLANEYAYTNQVKVGLKLSKDGAIQESKIISSSGSTQIDEIVLQSVKDTLNVVKPPSNEIKTPDFNLSLIIYF